MIGASINGCNKKGGGRGTYLNLCYNFLCSSAYRFHHHFCIVPQQPYPSRKTVRIHLDRARVIEFSNGSLCRIFFQARLSEDDDWWFMVCNHIFFIVRLNSVLAPPRGFQMSIWIGLKGALGSPRVRVWEFENLHVIVGNGFSDWGNETFSSCKRKEFFFPTTKKITHFVKYESKVTGLGLSGKEEGNLDRFLGHWSVEIKKFWKENCMQSIRPWSSFWFDRP